jgi:hypothetical protein
MGSTAALGAPSVKAGQPDQRRIGATRLYAHVGPRATILGGPRGRPQTTAHTPPWFRDRQFLFTYSPFTITKES